MKIDPELPTWTTYILGKYDFELTQLLKRDLLCKSKKKIADDDVLFLMLVLHIYSPNTVFQIQSFLSYSNPDEKLPKKR